MAAEKTEIEEQIDDALQENDEIPQALTESYSEITLLSKFCEESDGAKQPRKRPDSLVKDSNEWIGLDGHFSKEGQLTHFVAENLEYKIKLASPSTRRDFTTTPSRSTPSNTLPRQFLVPSHLTQIDSNVLNDVELEANRLASSVDNLCENLCNLLHSISSITADNVDCYRNAVGKLTDSMDSNIKSSYTIMAKTEEISRAMAKTEETSKAIKELKKLVDMLESNI